MLVSLADPSVSGEPGEAWAPVATLMAGKKRGTWFMLITAGVQVVTGGKLTINASVLEVTTSMLTVNAGMSTFRGTLKADAVITNSVISASYTPGAGNVM